MYFQVLWLFNPKIIFRNTRRIKSFFPYKDRLSRKKSKVVFFIGKTKRRLHDRKMEHIKALTSNSHSSAIADHITQTGHRIKWDHFDILATGQSDIHCKIKETLLIRDLIPALNENVMLAVRNFFSACHLYFSSRFN